MGECEASDTTKKCKCEDRFSSTKDTNKNCVHDEKAVKKHIKEMVDPAYTTTSAFCNYPDLQCKQKIQDAVESQMTYCHLRRDLHPLLPRHHLLHAAGDPH